MENHERLQPDPTRVRQQKSWTAASYLHSEPHHFLRYSRLQELGVLDSHQGGALPARSCSITSTSEAEQGSRQRPRNLVNIMASRREHGLPNSVSPSWKTNFLPENRHHISQTSNWKKTRHCRWTGIADLWCGAPYRTGYHLQQLSHCLGCSCHLHPKGTSGSATLSAAPFPRPAEIKASM